MTSLLLEHAALLGLIAAVLKLASQGVELGARLIDLAHRVLDLLRDLRDYRSGRWPDDPALKSPGAFAVPVCRSPHGPHAGDGQGDGNVTFLQLGKLRALEVVAAVNVAPNPSGIPGGDAAQKLINGGAAFGLLACVATVILGAAQWGFGSRSSNYSQADDGKTRMLKGVGGAFGIGAAAAVINFFFNAGSGVH